MKKLKGCMVLSCICAIGLLAGCTSTKKEEAKTEKKEEMQTIKVACMDSYFPYAYIDDDGNPEASL